MHVGDLKGNALWRAAASGEAELWEIFLWCAAVWAICGLRADSGLPSSSFVRELTVVEMPREVRAG